MKVEVNGNTKLINDITVICCSKDSISIKLSYSDREVCINSTGLRDYGLEVWVYNENPIEAEEKSLAIVKLMDIPFPKYFRAIGHFDKCEELLTLIQVSEDFNYSCNERLYP